MYGTDTTTERITRPAWGARVRPTTAHQPRNTKRDKRRDAAALLALYGDDKPQVS